MDIINELIALFICNIYNYWLIFCTIGDNNIIILREHLINFPATKAGMIKTIYFRNFIWDFVLNYRKTISKIFLTLHLQEYYKIVFTVKQEQVNLFLLLTPHLEWRNTLYYFCRFTFNSSEILLESLYSLIPIGLFTSLSAYFLATAFLLHHSKSTFLLLTVSQQLHLPGEISTSWW